MENGIKVTISVFPNNFLALFLIIDLKSCRAIEIRACNISIEVIFHYYYHELREDSIWSFFPCAPSQDDSPICWLVKLRFFNIPELAFLGNQSFNKILCIQIPDSPSETFHKVSFRKKREKEQI